MTTWKNSLKSIATRLGVFPQARAVYLMFEGRSRREREGKASIYSELVRPGDLFFDIGANLGQTTEAARRAGARVIAVEPNANCLPTLRWQFGKDRDVIIVPVAVGEKPARASLYSAGTSAASSLRSEWTSSYAGVSPESIERTEVEVVTLDLLIAKYGVPAFCKIDVEGFEVEVFMGLSHPIPMIQFEYHTNEIDRVERIFTHLATITPFEVNAAPMDSAGLNSFDWTSPGDAFAKLRAGRFPFQGDIFVRHSAT